MIRFIATYFFLLLSILLTAQSVSTNDLEAQLKKARSSEQKLALHYELGLAYLKTSKKKAEDHSYKAALLAREQGDTEMTARAYLLNAQAKLKNRDRKGAKSRFNTSFDYAKRSKNPQLVLEILPELVEIEKRYNNYQAAYNHTEDALNLIKDANNITSSNSNRPPSYSSGATFSRENRELSLQKRQLEDEIAQLRKDKAAIREDKSVLAEKEKQLNDEKTTIEEERSKIEAEREIIVATLQKKEARINRMSKEQLIAETKILEREKAINELKMKKQEQDLALLKSRERSRYLLLASALGLLLTLFLFLRYRANKKAQKVLEEKNKLIEDERERSDDLLKNILPAPIAEELKEKGVARARRYENATVMFSDFKNFTKISEQLTPEQLVQELDTCFKGFDQIIAQYKLEKIKTIGDAYMVASGLNDRYSVPLGIVKAALDMQEFLDDLKVDRIREGLPYFEARIGIHSGPVVAGVVGLSKFTYDIWGDTVNIAARMEANCEPGQINVSEETYRLIKYNFKCRYRGKISAKNKGEIDMYYVESKVGQSVPTFA